MIAAGHIGANASSRLHHSEGHRCNHHNSIQASTTASATPWTGEISNPDHLAARAVRQAAEAILAEKEWERHAAQYDSLVASLVSKDPDFHSEDVSAILYAAHLLRTMART